MDKMKIEVDNSRMIGVRNRDDDDGSVESVETKAEILPLHKKHYKKKAKGKKAIKLQKAPNAPKRFKSAFIFFTMEKHPEVREQLKKDGVKGFRTPDIAKIVSKQWQGLSPSEREVWEEKARKDKKRFMREKNEYTGPWKVISSSSLSKKDPNAPKRPMSSFLSYSNGKRAALKAKNPQFTNADLSKTLAQMWKEAPAEEKEVYIKREAILREKYKKDIITWRESVEKKKADFQKRLVHAEEVPYAYPPQQSLFPQEMETRNDRILRDHLSSLQAARGGFQMFEEPTPSFSILPSSSLPLQNNSVSQILNQIPRTGTIGHSGDDGMYLPAGRGLLGSDHDANNDFLNHHKVLTRTIGHSGYFSPSHGLPADRHCQYQNRTSSLLSVPEQRYNGGPDLGEANLYFEEENLQNLSYLSGTRGSEIPFGQRH